jgi:hypothetical protein
MRGKETSALVSRHFFYFGREAVGPSELPPSLRSVGLEKHGPGLQSDLSGPLVQELVSWFERTFELGRHGEACSPLPAAVCSRDRVAFLYKLRSRDTIIRHER